MYSCDWESRVWGFSAVGTRVRGLTHAACLQCTGIFVFVYHIIMCVDDWKNVM